MSFTETTCVPTNVPCSSWSGVSLKNQHFQDILSKKPKLDFFEIHAENFMSEGGNHLIFLEDVLKHYALSLHGVGMSLGSADGLSEKHLKAFKAIVDRFNPAMVSEHLAWSRNAGIYLNDLLPVPLTKESLSVVASNISTMQDYIGRQVLIENPSSYLSFAVDEMSEQAFLNALVEQTGCGLLLDINNVFVSASNMGWSAVDYLADLNVEAVGEIHLAGHTKKDIDGRTIRIDDHGSAVCDDVWSLYSEFVDVYGAYPTLIEWDNDVPALDVLVAESEKAQSIVRRQAMAS